MAYGAQVMTSEGMLSLADIPAMRRVGSVEVTTTGFESTGTVTIPIADQDDFWEVGTFVILAAFGYVSGNFGASHSHAAAIVPRLWEEPPFAEVDIEYHARRASSAGSMVSRIDLIFLEQTA